MRKIVLDVLLALMMIGLCGCTRKNYSDENRIWFSDSPQIEFVTGHEPVRFQSNIVISGIKYDAEVAISRSGKEISIYDATDLYDRPLIWECKAEYDKHKDILNLTVIEDNYSNCVGMKYSLKPRAIEDNEKYPSNEKEMYAYNSRLDLLQKAKIPSEIYEVFSENKEIVLDGKHTYLSEIADCYWIEFLYVDIDHDGENELLFDTMYENQKDVDDRVMYVFDYEEDVLVYKLNHNHVLHINEDGSVWGEDGTYIIEFNNGKIIKKACEESEASERWWITK